MSINRREAIASLGTSLAAMASGAAWAQEYPSRSIRLVVPFPAGGPADAIGRTAAQGLGSLGQSVVVDNKAGASGNIGSDFVAKAAPDGHTLLVGNIATNAINAYVYKTMPYDVLKDFTPICAVVAPLMTVSVHPSVPANSIAELIAYAKKNPGKLSYASSGLGTPHHLAMAQLCQMAGIDMVHVPYKGGAPATADVVGGQCPTGCLTLSVALPFHRAGKLKILGMTETTRASIVPDIPTVGETLKGFEMTNWQGIFGPAKLPPAVSQAVYRECAKAFTANKAVLESQGLGIFLQGPDQFAAFVAAENEKWRRFVRTLNLTLV
ncbi:MAG: tripartite tricarboxylate transporter substrate binding protein [Burkholderiaceae bacterium]|nr:tripartite tricarboxylate transporter substrate binding protein [Burkholderiaceae bacterium]